MKAILLAFPLLISFAALTQGMNEFVPIQEPYKDYPIVQQNITQQCQGRSTLTNTTLTYRWKFQGGWYLQEIFWSNLKEPVLMAHADFDVTIVFKNFSGGPTLSATYKDHFYSVPIGYEDVDGSIRRRNYNLISSHVSLEKLTFRVGDIDIMKELVESDNIEIIVYINNMETDACIARWNDPNYQSNNAQPSSGKTQSSSVSREKEQAYMYWLGLAEKHEKEGNYQLAVSAYSTARRLNVPGVYDYLSEKVREMGELTKVSQNKKLGKKYTSDETKELFEALEKGDLERFESLLQKGQDVNARNNVLSKTGLYYDRTVLSHFYDIESSLRSQFLDILYDHGYQLIIPWDYQIIKESNLRLKLLELFWEGAYNKSTGVIHAIQHEYLFNKCQNDIFSEKVAEFLATRKELNNDNLKKKLKNSSKYFKLNGCHWKVAFDEILSFQ